MSKKDEGFPDKLAKKLPHGFSEEIDSMSVDQIKNKIYDAEKNIFTIEAEKDKDEKLNGARELVKDLSLPYKEATDAQKAKIKYCFHRLTEMGEVIGESDED